MSRCTYLSAFCRFTTVLATAPAWAQHTELAANGDGSVLYVISHSVLRDATTPTHAQTRLYRVGPDGVQLFAKEKKRYPRARGRRLPIPVVMGSPSHKSLTMVRRSGTQCAAYAS